MRGMETDLTLRRCAHESFVPECAKKDGKAERLAGMRMLILFHNGDGILYVRSGRRGGPSSRIECG